MSVRVTSSPEGGAIIALAGPEELLRFYGQLLSKTTADDVIEALEEFLTQRLKPRVAERVIPAEPEEAPR